MLATLTISQKPLNDVVTEVLHFRDNGNNVHKDMLAPLKISQKPLNDVVTEVLHFRDNGNDVHKDMLATLKISKNLRMTMSRKCYASVTTGMTSTRICSQH